MKFEYEPGLAGTDARRPTWWNFFRRHPMQLSRAVHGMGAWVKDASGDWYDNGNGTSFRSDVYSARRTLGAWVQNPETGDWYDDGAGALVGPPPSDNIPGVLPEASNKGPSDWLTGIAAALPKISAFLTAEQLAQVNVDRAKRGLPALQTSQYAPQVGVGLDPGTAKLVMFGGIGLAAVILVPKLLARRSSRTARRR
jgi:hypothetical protein